MEIKVKNLTTKKVFTVDKDNFENMAPKHKRNFEVVGEVKDVAEIPVENKVTEININPPQTGDKKNTRKPSKKK